MANHKMSDNGLRLTIPVEEGSPWSVDLLASCDNIAPTSSSPKVEVFVLFNGRSKQRIADLGPDLLSSDLEVSLQKVITDSLNHLRVRHVDIPDAFIEELKSAILEARTSAIRATIRHQAATLIHEIPASEACSIWADAEASFIMSS